MSLHTGLCGERPDRLVPESPRRRHVAPGELASFGRQLVRLTAHPGDKRQVLTYSRTNSYRIATRNLRGSALTQPFFSPALFISITRDSLHHQHCWWCSRPPLGPFTPKVTVILNVTVHRCSRTYAQCNVRL